MKKLVSFLVIAILLGGVPCHIKTVGMSGNNVGIQKPLPPPKPPKPAKKPKPPKKPKSPPAPKKPPKPKPPRLP